MLSLILAAGALIGIPLATVLVAPPQAAHAAVVAGDVVFEQRQSGPPNYPAEIALRDSGGTVTRLGNSSIPEENHSPDISPDGSRIAFAGPRFIDGNPANGTLYVPLIMNSDGSGQTMLVAPIGTSPSVAYYSPVWSPDGTKLALEKQVGNDHYIAVMDADGSNETTLTTAGLEFKPTWSPDGTQLAYESATGSGGFYYGQIYIMDSDDGSNKHLVTGTDTGDSDSAPVWSPDGSRIYFFSSHYPASIYYFSSTDDFATTTNVTGITQLGGPNANTGTQKLKISADGTKLTYALPDDSGCRQIYTISTNTARTTKMTDTGCDYQHDSPTFVPATYPTAPPTNATVAVSAPSPSDAPYTRQITIGLSATGVQKFQYGWSTSSSTAPNTSYLQESTDLTAPNMGTLNYLGVYSGSGTTWNGGTQPDQDWYLWVRSVQTGGTPNSWGTPLLVHIPKHPVAVGVGDSTSSGHRQNTNEPDCAKEAPWPFTCEPSDFVPNDPSFSWVTDAAGKFNATLHVPTAWQLQPIVIAKSGAKTSDFGKSGATPGTPAWASAGQAGQMSVALYARYDSWNVVSMTGGANNKSANGTNWIDVMTQWYTDNFGANREPWDASSVVYCPNTEAVWQELHANDLTDAITDDLQGIVTVATAASPGVRVLNMNYPYPLDYGTQSTGNPCYSDWVISGDTYHGAKSVVDTLNSAHTAVTGSNVKNVDIKTAFGVNGTVSNGYIQLTSVYGYPHWSGGTNGGQSKAADTALTVLLGSGW